VGAPVIHFEIMGGPERELERFYAELFGWKMNNNNPMKYGIVDTGASGGISGGIGTANGGKCVSIYVQVSDLRATLVRVENLGGKTILAPTEVAGGPKLAMFKDPAGNIIGLMLGRPAK